jgi:hypothetical protein
VRLLLDLEPESDPVWHYLNNVINSKTTLKNIYRGEVLQFHVPLIFLCLATCTSQYCSIRQIVILKLRNYSLLIPPFLVL